MTFAELLIEKRRDRGWSQEYAAEKAGVSAVTFSHWENGTLPSDSRIGHVAETFGITHEELGSALADRYLGRQKNVPDRHSSFPAMMFLDADSHYLKNLTFSAEEVSLIRNICTLQENRRYADWNFGSRFSYDPSVLRFVSDSENIGISAVNRTAHGLWLKFTDNNSRDPHEDVLRYIIQYLMENPKGIEAETFCIDDMEIKDFLYLAWALLYTADRTLQYNIAWIPDFDNLVRIVYLINRKKFSVREFIEDERLLYDKSLKPEHWLLSGREIGEWARLGPKEPEPGLSENADKVPQLTQKGRAFAAYIEDNKSLFGKYIERSNADEKR